MKTVEHRWRKSSRSSNQTDCVEVSHTLVAVRDSKNPSGPALAVDAQAFIRAVRDGRMG
jgi:hypothetical protein